MTELKHPKEVYCEINPFEGEMDLDIKCRTVKVVKVRKEHKCYLCQQDNHILESLDVL